MTAYAISKLAGKFTVKYGKDDITAICNVCHGRWKCDELSGDVCLRLLSHYANNHPNKDER